MVKKTGIHRHEQKRRKNEKEGATGTYVFNKDGRLVKVSSKIPGLSKSHGEMTSNNEASAESTGFGGSEDFSSGGMDFE